MASTATSATRGIASPALLDGKSASRLQPAPQSVGLPPLASSPQVASPSRPQQGKETWKTASYCRRVARNVIAMAAGDVAAGVATDVPEIVKTIQETWDKIEDKYAVAALGVSGFVGLWITGGGLSAIDRLPVIPGLLEVVGIGYTGWFAYRNLVFKPDREALIAKIKSTYNDIIGISS